tara:strand:+ start:59 stop:727 length:669 start_codon:yes stop_codon:yes gene_type:complete
MDVSYLKKYCFEENSKINIVANKVINEIINNIDVELLKYINFFNKGKIPETVLDCFFFSLLSLKNIEVFFDTKHLLNGQLLDNEFNNFMSEDSIILLFLKFNIFCVKEINKIIPKKDFVEDIILDKINKYQNIFDDVHSDLLIKNLPEVEKNKLLFEEIQKIKKSFLSTQLILSYYFFKLEESGINNFKIFINKVEDLTDSLIKNNLNSSLDEFWNYLITNI